VEAVLPPKRADMDPQPETVDEADFEESDVVDVRARSFPASQNFFDQDFTSQFGEGEDDWEDEDSDDDDLHDHFHHHHDRYEEPECRPQ